MRVEASAPSNIALIKYMGKVPGGASLPANASLSYTLDSFKTFVAIESLDETADQWAPLEGFEPLALSASGEEKYLRFFLDLKRLWKIPGHHRVQSANNFPSDCGLASSASSFAALTKATYELAKKTHPALDLNLEQLSVISRGGSGSSCRSFFSPWAEWSGGGAHAVDIDLKLKHAVILIDASRKAVSSSEAHKRILTSANWPGRVGRAEKRLSELKTALQSKNWSKAFEICWSEFWDMHALFETSEPTFGFMTGETVQVLNRLREVWRENGDGPLVTMDAGANIHLLYREDQSPESWWSGLKVRRSDP